MIEVILLVAGCLMQAEANWPEFQGPGRANKSADRGLLRRWPAEGPKLLWRAEGIGEGYASVAIGGGLIYTAGNVADDTRIVALDLKGKHVWWARQGAAYQRSVPGSRSTPTLDGDRLYYLNGEGELACLDAPAGTMLWSVGLVQKFGGRMPTWGFAESVLVDGPRVIASPGGERAAVVALDKQSGRTIWQCRGAGDAPAYASPILVDYQGLRQIVTMTAESAIGVSADDGRLLWRYPREAPYDVNAATPLYHDGHVAISTTWGRGTTLLCLKVRGRECSVEKVWHNPAMDNEHGGLILLAGHLYGLADGGHKKRHWACANWTTGEITYQAPFPGASATLTYADGMLYLLSDRREVALQRPDPKRFDVVSRFTLPKDVKGPVWARPVVCGGCLYVRHAEYLYAYALRD